MSSATAKTNRTFFLPPENPSVNPPSAGRSGDDATARLRLVSSLNAARLAQRLNQLDVGGRDRPGTSWPNDPVGAPIKIASLPATVRQEPDLRWLGRLICMATALASSSGILWVLL